MSDARRKDDGVASCCEAMPMGDDVADELRLVHALGKLRLDVIASFNAYTVQVRLRRSIDAASHEVAAPDQLSDIGALDQRLEHVPEPAPIASAWRSGQSNDDCLGVCVEQPPVRPRPAMVRF